MSGRTRFLPSASGWGRFTRGHARVCRSGVISNSVVDLFSGLVEEKEEDGEGGATDTGGVARLALGRAGEGRPGPHAGPGSGWVHSDGPGFPSKNSARPLEAGRMWASEGTKEGLACLGLEEAAWSHRRPGTAFQGSRAWIDHAQGPRTKAGPTISARDIHQVPAHLSETRNPDTCPLTAAERGQSGCAGKPWAGPGWWQVPGCRAAGNGMGGGRGEVRGPHPGSGPFDD